MRRPWHGGVRLLFLIKHRQNNRIAMTEFFLNLTFNQQTTNVFSGMISAGEPFPNFTREEWADYLATIERCKL